jgi:hypothetical protein
MNRKTILFLLFVNLIFLGAVGFQLWNRYIFLQTHSVPTVAPQEELMADPTASQIPADALSPDPSSSPPLDHVAPPTPSEATVSAAESRRTFLFQSGTAKSVQLVGDFNEWTPQPFQKGKAGQWSVTIALAPGDYSYNFIVDGKAIRDPNQRRTDLKERSLLTVSP